MATRRRRRLDDVEEDCIALRSDDNNDNNSNNERELTRSAESFEDVVFVANGGSSSSNNDGSGDGGGSSSAWAATLNFTNCIIGAGAIGLGGAIAQAGGLIAIAAVIFFAVLVKLSLDLVIQVGTIVDVDGSGSGGGSLASYEELGFRAFGRAGKCLVMASKFAYSAGCLVAYIVVIQDNFGPALMNLIFHNTKPTTPPWKSWSWLYWLLGHDVWLTWLVSTVVILPLCLLRDMSPLASASFVSVISMLSIVVIVIYLWWIGVNDDNDHNNNDGGGGGGTSLVEENSILAVLTSNSTASASASSTFYQHWLEIRWGGFLDNLGTFVFTFVCQHTAHLTYESLKPEIRTLSTWKKVTTASLTLSCLVSLAIGVFVYMTFWEKTESDIFEIYPSSVLLDLAKLLLCITMLLTFPLPFLTCRELFIVFFFPVASDQQDSDVGQAQDDQDDDDDDIVGTLEEPLLSTTEKGELSSDWEQPAVDDDGQVQDQAHESAPAALESAEESSTPSIVTSVVSVREAINFALLPGEERQLKLPYHVGFTFKIWFIVTALAIASPNLGDVLDLVGCVSGTLIAFILPGCFAIRLQGYSHTAGLILVVGGIVGSVGTFFSLKQFVKDTFGSH